MTSNMHNHEHELTPTELSGISSALDRLGASDRTARDGGLESRLFAASVGHLGAEPTTVIARIRPRTLAWRMAAGIAVAGATIGAAVFMLNRTPTPSTTQTESVAIAIEGPRLDESLDDLALGIGSEFRSLDEDISAIDVELAAMESDLNSNWLDGDWSIGENEL